jgi:hypothetical protein
MKRDAAENLSCRAAPSSSNNWIGTGQKSGNEPIGRLSLIILPSSDGYAKFAARLFFLLCFFKQRCQP